MCFGDIREDAECLLQALGDSHSPETREEGHRVLVQEARQPGEGMTLILFFLPRMHLLKPARLWEAASAPRTLAGGGGRGLRSSLLCSLCCCPHRSLES